MDKLNTVRGLTWLRSETPTPDDKRIGSDQDVGIVIPSIVQVRVGRLLDHTSVADY